MTKSERIISAMFSIKHLVKGWSSLNNPLTKEQMSKLFICNDCTHCVKDEWIDVVDSKVTECKGTMCDLCGCPNVVLVRSEKKCKANKW